MYMPYTFNQGILDKRIINIKALVDIMLVAMSRGMCVKGFQKEFNMKGRLLSVLGTV